MRRREEVECGEIRVFSVKEGFWSDARFSE